MSEEADTLPELTFTLGLDRRSRDVGEGGEVDAPAYLEGLDSRGTR